MASLAGAPSAVAAPVVVTFQYTGSAQTFTVPDGITGVTIVAYGAQGGASGGYMNNNNNENVSVAAGGLGGAAQATVPVTPGQQLQVDVGGRGGDGVVTNDPTATYGAAGFNGG